MLCAAMLYSNTARMANETEKTPTVGAQSIARRHSTYVIIPKRPKFRKKILEKLRRRSLQADSLKKNSVFSRLKLLNKPFSKRTYFFLTVFCQ